MEFNVEKIWPEILERLKNDESIQPSMYDGWIAPTEALSITDDTLMLSVPSTLHGEFIKKQFKDTIQNHLKDIIDKDIIIDISVNKPIEIKQPETKKKKNTILDEFSIDKARSISNGLNLKYTFKNFVIGPNNHFCHAASTGVAKEPGKKHNPLFIYGGTGLGKTHIMQAIGHYVLVNHPGKRIKYVTTEDFVSSLINALRSGDSARKLGEFKERYRSIDLLLIDDIQFIEGKNTTQIELFTIFEYLYNSGKQIVITSDRHPKEIESITDRLRSRFEWGLLVDVGPPDIETRVAILKNKSQQDDMDIPDEILYEIAKAKTGNVRELEGALNLFIAYVSLNNKPITINTAKEILGHQACNNPIPSDKIINAVGDYYSISSADIKGQSRSKEISLARQVAIYLIREINGLSFPSIGDLFGKRKHTTVLYSYEKIKEEISTKKELSNIVNKLARDIAGKSL